MWCLVIHHKFLCVSSFSVGAAIALVLRCGLFSMVPPVFFPPDVFCHCWKQCFVSFGYGMACNRKQCGFTCTDGGILGCLAEWVTCLWHSVKTKACLRFTGWKLCIFFLNLCWLVKNSAQSVHCCIAVQQTKYRKSRVTLWKNGRIQKWDSSLIHIITDPRLYEIWHTESKRQQCYVR